jgi:hypothetical protein
MKKWMKKIVLFGAFVASAALFHELNGLGLWPVTIQNNTDTTLFAAQLAVFPGPGGFVNRIITTDRTVFPSGGQVSFNAAQSMTSELARGAIATKILIRAVCGQGASPDEVTRTLVIGNPQFLTKDEILGSFFPGTPSGTYEITLDKDTCTLNAQRQEGVNPATTLY